MSRPPMYRLFTPIMLVLVGLSLFGPTVAADEPQEPQALLAWGQPGAGPGEFHSPIHLAITPRGELLVTDLNNARLQRFSTDGTFLGEFPLPHDAPPRVSTIIGGMAVDAEGQIYLSFMVQNRLAVYRENGELVREWGKLGATAGEFHQPGGLVLYPDGTLFVADQCNHRVQQCTTTGEHLAMWGKHGHAVGEFGGEEPAGSRFAGPHFLAMDSAGRLYTTEGVMGRIQQLTQTGKPLLAWGDKGDQPGGFGALDTGFSERTFGPIGVYVDRYDRVWVSSLNDRVQGYTAEGKLLFSLGGPGSDAGKFEQPHGMVMDDKNHLYVADAGNQRVQKFLIPAPTQP